MKTIEYLFYLSHLQKDRLRVKAYREKDKILEFIVQYEANIHGEWHPIIRYDTRHGFAHRDLLHADGSIDKEPLLWQDYNLALTHTTLDLKQNWQKYRQNYENEINDRK